MLAFLAISILKLGPLNSVESIVISGVPKSTIYSIGSVSSSIILNWVFSFKLLGKGSYNFIKKLLLTPFSAIKLTPVKIILLLRFNAKSLK